MYNNVNSYGPVYNQNLGQQPVVIVPVMGQQALPRPDVRPTIVVPRPNNLQNHQFIVEQPNQREVRLDIPLSQQGPNVNPNQVQHARVPYRGPVQENRRDEQPNHREVRLDIPLAQQGPSLNPHQVQHATVPYRGQVQEIRRDELPNRQPLSQKGQGGLFFQKK